MSTVLIESHFLPSLEYFCAVMPFDNIVLENHEYYVKQSLRNRCYINTAHGIEMLVVPVTGKHGKVPFGEIGVETGKRWRNNQWRTIQSAYAKAPFFEHYSDDLNRLLFTEYRFLRELNEALLSFCLKSLGKTKQLSATVTYDKERHDVSDHRSLVNIKPEWSARRYYQPCAYHQVFGKTFAENLSVVDLLFCEGPGAAGNLKASEKKI